MGSATMLLIEQRLCAIFVGNFEEEKNISREAKRSARNHKRAWLLELAGSRSWSAARHLRSGFIRSQGRLNDEHGTPLSSEQRAEILPNIWKKFNGKLDQPVLQMRLPYFILSQSIWKH